jgi:small neutral amino acid transporter SnatA (MarC family)
MKGFTMTRFTRVQKVTMAALIIALLFNPLSFEVLLEYFRWSTTALSIAASAWVIGFLLYKVFRPEKVNTKKNKKQQVKATEYLEA